MTNKAQLYRVSRGKGRAVRYEWLVPWMVTQLRSGGVHCRRCHPRVHPGGKTYTVSAQQFKGDRWAIIREGLSYGKADTLIRKLRPLCRASKMRLEVPG